MSQVKNPFAYVYNIIYNIFLYVSQNIKEAFQNIRLFIFRGLYMRSVVYLTRGGLCFSACQHYSQHITKPTAMPRTGEW